MQNVLDVSHAPTAHCCPSARVMTGGRSSQTTAQAPAPSRRPASHHLFSAVMQNGGVDAKTTVCAERDGQATATDETAA
eukprot:55310-Eustigmatos_ZCMA.PRE.1